MMAALVTGFVVTAIGAGGYLLWQKLRTSNSNETETISHSGQTATQETALQEPITAAHLAENDNACVDKISTAALKDEPEKTCEKETDIKTHKDNEMKSNSIEKVAEKIDYRPKLVKAIRTKAAKKESKGVFGLTVLDQELFVLNNKGSDVEVYDSETLTFKRSLQLKLTDAVDIISCSSYKCLYIFDWHTCEILKVDAKSGETVKVWSTGEDHGYLSITTDSNVLLTAWNKNQLNEYTPDGELIRQLPVAVSASPLCHSVKLRSKQFVVSHDDEENHECGVSMVDIDGLVFKSFGNKTFPNLEQLDSPNYIAVDKAGSVFVADQNNKRVILLNPNLEFEKELMKEEDGLRYPVRMHLDEENGRIFIADNDYLTDQEIWRDGRVIAFDLK